MNIKQQLYFGFLKDRTLKSLLERWQLYWTSSWWEGIKEGGWLQMSHPNLTLNKVGIWKHDQPAAHATRAEHGSGGIGFGQNRQPSRQDRFTKFLNRDCGE